MTFANGTMVAILQRVGNELSPVSGTILVEDADDTDREELGADERSGPRYPRPGRPQTRLARGSTPAFLPPEATVEVSSDLEAETFGDEVTEVIDAVTSRVAPTR